MEELRVLIEATIPTGGELHSAWFELPIDEEELEEKIGVEADSGDYRIIEKELPFKDDVREDTEIDTLNDLYATYESLPADMKEDVRELLTHFSSLDELHQHRYDIIHYAGCNSMIDVARHVLADNPEFHTLSEELLTYFDYEAYGQYLEENGTFLETDTGIYELP